MKCPVMKILAGRGGGGGGGGTDFYNQRRVAVFNSIASRILPERVTY